MIEVAIASLIMGVAFTIVIFMESIVFMIRAEDPGQYQISWNRVMTYTVLLWIISAVSYYGVGFLSGYIAPFV